MAAPVLDLHPGDDLALGAGQLWTDFTVTGVDTSANLNLALFEIVKSGGGNDLISVQPDAHVTVGPVSAGGSQRVYYDGVAVALLSHPDNATTRLYFTADATIPIVDAVANALWVAPQDGVTYARTFTATFNLRNASDQETGRISYLTGSPSGDVAYGAPVTATRGGNDTVYIPSGTRYIDGGDGNDTAELRTGPSIDYQFDLASQDPQFFNSAIGTITVKNFENYTDIYTAASATVFGTEEANTITLYRGTIHARGGNDTMAIYAAGTLDGGEGNDTVTFKDIYNYRQGVSIDLRNEVQLGRLTFISVENVIGTGAADTLVGNDFDNILDGGLGRNVLTGNGGNDTLIGNRGADTLDGGDGDDMLVDGGGSDTLIGGIGTDTVDYRGFNGAVHVSLSVTAQQDTNAGGLDTLSGIENIISGNGNDRLTGTTGVNDIRGGNGSDTIAGLGGTDALFGEAGNDNLLGGAGNDRLTGGLGRDILTGGADADVFIFTQLADSAVGGQRDLITDFAQGIDKIDVTGISAEADVNQVFIGSAAFSGTAGQIRYFQGGGQTIIAGDVTGDGIADYQIQLKGLYTVQGTDFV